MTQLSFLGDFREEVKNQSLELRKLLQIMLKYK